MKLASINEFYGDYGIGGYHKIDHASWALALISRSAIDHQPGFQVENDQIFESTKQLIHGILSFHQELSQGITLWLWLT